MNCACRVIWVHALPEPDFIRNIVISLEMTWNTVWLEAFLIFWRGASTISNKPMLPIVLHKTDATPLDLIWLKIGRQNDRKVLQFFHFPVTEAPSFKGIQDAIGWGGVTQNAIPAKVHFSDTDPELIAGLFGLL